jgi:nitrite reductase/ring-hydroxylating ferredoxin subunit/alkylhydroperoxidase/carboxymuconolactone decarboxylase family protein YurZ
MSDALDYLMKARPDAMRSYFDFMREAGRHLDARTRAIISVITKVDNQTVAGFRQYLKRALAEGVTPNEILDALLVASPTLGLSKIVWAADQLLAMQLPEFAPERLAEGGAWHGIGPMAELPAAGTVRRRSADRELLIHCAGGELRLYDARCPHQSTMLPATPDGDGCLTCPKHGWRFDLESGACVANGDRPLRRLPHRVENGMLEGYW